MNKQEVYYPRHELKLNASPTEIYCSKIETHTYYYYCYYYYYFFFSVLFQA